MSEMETAQLHLNQALRRLEAALVRRLSEPGSGEGDQRLSRLAAERDAMARDVAMLRSECDRLTAALGGTEHDNSELQRVTSQVAQRLDGSIAELDRLLGG
jgi:hypothetical protein